MDQDHSLDRSWCIKWADESVTKVDSSVPLMYYTPCDHDPDPSHPTRKHPNLRTRTACIDHARSPDLMRNILIDQVEVYFRKTEIGGHDFTQTILVEFQMKFLSCCSCSFELCL